MRLATLLLAVTAVAAVAWNATAADGIRVTLSVSPPVLTVGRAWTAKLTVHPASFAGEVVVAATGRTRFAVRATGVHGSYRARLLFRAAGRWRLTARAGGSTSSLGSVLVRKAAPVPLAFVWPTSVEVEPDGSLLLVENGLRRLLRVDANGRVTEIAALTKPYAVRRTGSGSIYVTDGPTLLRIDGTSAPARVAQVDSDIGPIAVAANGDVYFTTETALYELPGGRGAPVRIGAQLSRPHGLAIAADGSVLVCDSGSHRILRVDPASGAVTTFAPLDVPQGLAVGEDGTVYVGDGAAGRVLHFSAAGTRLGYVGPVFDDPYDLRLARDGTLYVVESLASGDVRRVAPDGTVTTVSHR
jgi:sugar lactone lactonase YvrE